MTQDIRSFENHLWLVVQVPQESLVSPCAVLLGDWGFREGKRSSCKEATRFSFVEEWTD